jgi:[ribosomal protein S18]-alanine N-acetyltransferase
MQNSSRRRSIETVLVRPAILEDIPYIRALEQQADTAAHWSEREYDALFAADAPPRIALIAINEPAAAQIHGFAMARRATDEWEIENVVVAPEYRRLGIATKLIREILLQARTAGATSVLLEVRESNLAARRLYEKLGFGQQGRRSNYYRDPPEDGLVLQISIKNGKKVP